MEHFSPRRESRNRSANAERIIASVAAIGASIAAAIHIASYMQTPSGASAVAQDPVFEPCEASDHFLECLDEQHGEQHPEETAPILDIDGFSAVP